MLAFEPWHSDQRVAVLDGYRRIGRDFPGMGEHRIRIGLIFDGRFDPSRPEVLNYVDVDGTPPAHARERDLSEGTFRPAPDDLVVTLRLLPGATWVADYYPVESAEQVPAAEGGGLVVRMRTADTAWLHRLVWRLGGGAMVLDPPQVVAEVRDGASSALTAYPATVGEG